MLSCRLWLCFCLFSLTYQWSFIKSITFITPTESAPNLYSKLFCLSSLWLTVNETIDDFIIISGQKRYLIQNNFLPNIIWFCAVSSIYANGYHITINGAALGIVRQKKVCIVWHIKKGWFWTTRVGWSSEFNNSIAVIYQALETKQLTKLRSEENYIYILIQKYT